MVAVPVPRLDDAACFAHSGGAVFIDDGAAIYHVVGALSSHQLSEIDLLFLLVPRVRC